MNNSYENRTVQRYGQAEAVNAGLRVYMQKVFTYMAVGLGITGAVAYALAQSPAVMNLLFSTNLFWLVALAPLAIVFFLSFRIDSLSFSTAQTLFYVYAGAVGVSLSSIFIVYTQQSIARVFFISGATFAAMSLYGYTTKKDLTAWGSFLFMGLVGIVIASLVNLFMQSSAVQFVVSVMGVLIFTGLTAYDTQRIKDMYYSAEGEVLAKRAIHGALMLYLDFINLFMSLLRLFGERR